MTLTAGKYVGLIPLTQNLAVDVRPKLPVSNLARVLDGARTSIESIAGVDRLYLTGDYPSSSVLEFLLSNLLDALRPIRVGGLYKDYVRRTDVVSHPRGKIQLVGTLQSCWSHGIRHRVKTERFEQTSDVAPNRLLKSALTYVLTGLGRARGDKTLIRRANDELVQFPDQIKAMSPADYRACKHLIEGDGLPASRRYYVRALEISLLILSGKSVSLDNTGDDLLLETFIVDFEAVFEDYLRRSLQRLAPFGLSVRDGNNEGKKPLFDDKRDPPAQPDIVIFSHANGRRLIAEVKYKERPDRTDINQAVTYAVTYRTKHVVLVHQSKVGTLPGLKRIGIIDGIVVDSYGFDLANVALEVEEQALATALFGLLDAD